MRGPWVWGGGVLALMGIARAEVPADPFQFALFAVDRVELGQGARVTGGDVGCDLERSRILLRARTRVAGTVAGDTIQLGRNASATAFQCITVVGTNGPHCQTITFPLVDATTLPPVLIVAGGEDVKLPARAFRDGLAPGTYGRVRIGTRSRLTLSGGTYAFRSLSLSREATLLCESACTIGVEQPVVVGSSSIVSSVEPRDPAKVRVEVEFGGSGRRAAFRASNKSRVDATVYAPNGILRFGKNGRFTGRFVGKEIQVLQDARVVAATAATGAP